MKKVLLISIAVFLAVVMISEYTRYKRTTERTAEIVEEIVTEEEFLYTPESTPREAYLPDTEFIMEEEAKAAPAPLSEEPSEPEINEEEIVEEAAEPVEEQAEEEKKSFFERLFSSTDKPDEDIYRIVCIGDSVTAHPYMAPDQNPLGYWLQDWGMAASAEDKDYAHVLANMYASDGKEVSLDVYNYNAWEMAEASQIPRSSYLSSLDTFFSSDKPQADLVVLQLGENCTQYQSLSVDFGGLIDYLRQKAPSAEIVATGTIIIMDPPRNAAVDAIKQQVCAEKGVVYVDMSGYNESMWVGEGTQIVNPQGQVTIISVSQRTHPGDYGMQWIAQQIYSAT